MFTFFFWFFVVFVVFVVLVFNWVGRNYIEYVEVELNELFGEYMLLVILIVLVKGLDYDLVGNL